MLALICVGGDRTKVENRFIYLSEIYRHKIIYLSEPRYAKKTSTGKDAWYGTNQDVNWASFQVLVLLPYQGSEKSYYADIKLFSGRFFLSGSPMYR